MPLFQYILPFRIKEILISLQYLQFSIPVLIKSNVSVNKRLGLLY